MPDDKKITYVMKSRVDRERAIYENKLTQIKENLTAQLPHLNGLKSSDDSGSDVTQQVYLDLLKQI